MHNFLAAEIVKMKKKIIERNQTFFVLVFKSVFKLPSFFFETNYKSLTLPVGFSPLCSTSVVFSVYMFLKFFIILEDDS